MPTQLDSRQIKKRIALLKLGAAAGSTLESILDKINTETDFPLRMAASATPDALLNFSSSLVATADGANEVVPPVSKQVFSSLASPTINFQTQALSNAADFDITWGTATLSQFRFATFTLISSGKIKVQFSSEFVSEAALVAAVNPGSLYASGGLPIGYITLQATQASPAAYKTSGSATDIIENAKIYRFGTGGGSSGANSGSIKVNLVDPVNTVLPTGTGATIDGVAVANDDLVLFTNLSSGNNRIYKVSGVGVSLAWTAQDVFENGLDPSAGESVRPTEGNAFEGFSGVYFDSTNSFNFNDYVRYFSGADYFEQSSLKSFEAPNNTISDLFSVASAGSENMIIDFSILRNGIKRTGTVVVTTDGTNISSPATGAALGDTGVDLYAEIDGANIEFKANVDNAGSDALIKYSVKRWSDVAGGPAGLPNYSGSGISGTLAGGNIQEIQFHGLGGVLAGDSSLKWDSSSKQINMNGSYIGSLESDTLADNQVSPSTVISFAVASYKFAFIDYSIERNGESRWGTLKVGTNGTVVGITDLYDDTGGAGIDGAAILFSAVISSGNVLIQYTSSSTGFTASFKSSMRRWL